MKTSIRVRNKIAGIFDVLDKLLRSAAGWSQDMKWFIWRCPVCGKSMYDTPCFGTRHPR